MRSDLRNNRWQMTNMVHRRELARLETLIREANEEQKKVLTDMQKLMKALLINDLTKDMEVNVIEKRP